MGSPVRLANFYAPTSAGLRTAVDTLGRGYEDAGHERVLVVPGQAHDADEDTASGRRITMRSRPASPARRGTGYWPRARGGGRGTSPRWRPNSLEVSDKLTLRRPRGVGHAGARSTHRARPPTNGSTPSSRPACPGSRPAPKGRRRPVEPQPRPRLRHDRVRVELLPRAEFQERIGATNVRRISTPGSTSMSSDPASRPKHVDRGDQLRLVYVGRLSKEKRPDLAVETLRFLVRGRNRRPPHDRG